MRLFFIFILAIITFQSCSSSSEDSVDMTKTVDTTPMNTPNDTPSDNMGNMGTSSALYQGDFVASAHATQGKATVNSEKTILNFTGFKTSNGPLLDVYLATDTSAGTYIDLGVLKGINGDYDYDLPSNVDFTTYKYVVIWCVEAHVNFGYAVLE